MNLRKLRSVQGKICCGGCWSLRQRLGVANQKQKRQTRSDFDGQPGFAVNGRQHADPGRRRLGACLLLKLSKSSPRLHQSVVECGELGRSGEELLSCFL